MSEIIFPRSPSETMCGWVHLARFIDKIRLHLAGRLAPDYIENFTKGFDKKWLEAAGLNAEEFIAVVKNTITDGEVANWVAKNVKKSRAEKAKHRDWMLQHGREPEMQGRLKWRKEQAGLQHRDDIQTFVAFIDADEKRS
jgi:gluconokinase